MGCGHGGSTRCAWGAEGCRGFCLGWRIGFRAQFMAACMVVVGGTAKDVRGQGHSLVCFGGVLQACQQPPLGLGQRPLTPGEWR